MSAKGCVNCMEYMMKLKTYYLKRFYLYHFIGNILISAFRRSVMSSFNRACRSKGNVFAYIKKDCLSFEENWKSAKWFANLNKPCLLVTVFTLPSSKHETTIAVITTRYSFGDICRIASLAAWQITSRSRNQISDMNSWRNTECQRL